MNFEFTNDYKLENDKVLLRPLQQDDLKHLLPFSNNEPDLWTYSLQNAAGEENLRQYVEKAIEGRRFEKEYPFIAFDKITSEYAGCTRFYDINLSFQTMLLGFTWYGKKFQRTHVNRNCKFLLLQFAFEIMNMERLEFRADAQNENSIVSMLSFGCKKEGILRSNVPKPGYGRRDSIVLSILKKEWVDEVKVKLGGNDSLRRGI